MNNYILYKDILDYRNLFVFEEYANSQYILLLFSDEVFILQFCLINSLATEIAGKICPPEPPVAKKILGFLLLSISIPSKHF